MLQKIEPDDRRQHLEESKKSTFHCGVFRAGLFFFIPPRFCSGTFFESVKDPESLIGKGDHRCKSPRLLRATTPPASSSPPVSRLRRSWTAQKPRAIFALHHMVPEPVRPILPVTSSRRSFHQGCSRTAGRLQNSRCSQRRESASQSKAKCCESSKAAGPSSINF